MVIYSRELIVNKVKEILHNKIFPQITNDLYDYQYDAIISIINYNTFVSLKTGSGKSIIYWIATLVISKLKNNLSSFAVVIEPLRAIIIQQIKDLNEKYNIRAIKLEIEDDLISNINFETGTNTIEVYINFLRNKIDKDFSEKLIHTRPGFGYYLKND
jgi:replicative superfamily II helicase